MKESLITLDGKVSRYDISKATRVWATDIATLAERVGATEYCVIIQDGPIKRCIECYTVVDALKIVDYVKANLGVVGGGIHAPAPAATRISEDFNRAIKLMALRA
jgi:hypothetical protein